MVGGVVLSAQPGLDRGACETARSNGERFESVVVPLWGDAYDVSVVPGGPLQAVTATEQFIYDTYADGTPDEADIQEPSAALIPKMQVAANAAASAGFVGDKLVVIVAIAGRESTYDPNVLNDDRGTGDLSYGLWQINMIDGLGPSRRAQFGIAANEDLWDPVTSARAARTIYDQNPGIPFEPWGPYKPIPQPPLHGGAENWVRATINVLTDMGYLDSNGDPAVPTGGTASLASSTSAAGGSGCGPEGGLTILQGPDCDGLSGSRQVFSGFANGDSGITSVLVSTPNISLAQPNAAARYDELVAAAVADGFDAASLRGASYGTRPGTYSLHPVGLAVDIGSLTGGAQVAMDNEPNPVNAKFDDPLYLWLRDNSWKFGWCNPRWARPVYLNGNGTGGHYADGTFAGYEPWHFEFVAGSTGYASPRAGDLSGPFGVPD